MRRNPANESVVEFVVTVRNSMLAAAEVMGAAETAVGKGYAKDFTVRVISEGASPALGIRFIYDSSDNVLDREGKITRILEKAGGHVAGSSHARRNPLPMETDPFHPSKWLGNSTKGAFLDIGLKGSRNRQSLRGFVRIEPVVSLKSGFPLTHVAARYTSTIPEHWSSEGVLVDESPGHTLSIRFTFETPEGSASWLIFYGPYRPAKASEWHPEAPKSLVEAARVTKRHFESLFGQARLNPRRNPEGERHTSLKEQAESALLWERIRNAKSQKEALAHYRAALLAAENEQRLLRDRKKAGKGRKPKPVYTKEYLTKKGMPRRNPFEMFRRPGDLFSVSIPFTSSTPLSVEFSKTDPGEQRRFRLLPNSPKEAGWLKPIIGKWLSADDALDLAVEAEGLSKNMYSSYPRHEYRDAARFYEGMSVVFFGLAEAVQTPWGR